MGSMTVHWIKRMREFTDGEGAGVLEGSGNSSLCIFYRLLYTYLLVVRTAQDKQHPPPSLHQRHKKDRSGRRRMNDLISCILGRTRADGERCCINDQVSEPLSDLNLTRIVGGTTRFVYQKCVSLPPSLLFSFFLLLLLQKCTPLKSSQQGASSSSGWMHLIL